MSDDERMRLDEAERKVRVFLAQHGDENMERVMVEYDRRGAALAEAPPWPVGGLCDDSGGPSGAGGPCVLPPGHPHTDGIGGTWPSDTAEIEPDAWTPAETDSGEGGRAPVWRFETAAADTLTARDDLIDFEGWVVEGPEVDAIERDARRILSAVAWHRRAAAQASTKVDPASRSEWTSPHTWRDPDCIECGGEGAPCCEPPAPVESEETP